MDRHTSEHLELRLHKLEEPRSRRLRQLLEGLENLFFEEGFLKFRMEDLARRLRCSKHTLYVLAPSREELFELVIERFLSRLRAEGERAASAAPDRISAVTAYLEAAVCATQKNSAQFISDIADFDPCRRRLRNHQRQRVAELEAIVAAGVEAGDFSEIHPKLVAEVMVHTLSKIVDPHFLAACGLTVSEAYREFYRWVVYGLAASNGRGSRARNGGRKPARKRLSHNGTPVQTASNGEKSHPRTTRRAGPHAQAF